MTVTSKNGYELNVPTGYHLGRSGGLMRNEPKKRMTKKQRRQKRETGKHVIEIAMARDFLSQCKIPTKSKLISKKLTWTKIITRINPIQIITDQISEDFEAFKKSLTDNIIKNLNVPAEVLEKYPAKEWTRKANSRLSEAINTPEGYEVKFITPAPGDRQGKSKEKT